MKTRWTTLLLAACLASAACGPKDAPPAERSAPAQQDGPINPSDIASYKLSMDKVDKFFEAQRNMALKLKSLTPAQQEALSLSGSGSLDEMAQKLESSPEWGSAIRDAGLEPREYVMLTMSMLQSAMAASVLKMRPNDDRDSLVTSMHANMDNVKFVQEHETEINAKREAMEKEVGGEGS
jgi:predicted small lipoprotein YifL